jgi:hypothetical protein
MKDQRLYLVHIQECIEKIEEYTKEGESAFPPILPATSSPPSSHQSG